MNLPSLIISSIIFSLICQSFAFLEPGKWSFGVKQKSCHYFQVHKALYQDSHISIRVACDPTAKNKDLKVKIGWVVRHSPCFEEYMEPEINMPTYLRVYYECPFKTIGDFGYSDVLFHKRKEIQLPCNHLMDGALKTKLGQQFERSSFTANRSRCISPEAVACDSSPPPPVLYALAEAELEMSPLNQPIVRLDKRSIEVDDSANYLQKLVKVGTHNSEDHQVVVPTDGLYLIIIKVTGEPGTFFDLQIDVEAKSPYGYLSAVEYPLLYFYSFMCVIYVCFATYWIIVSAIRWRDLLRIQFWIGAVIFLGMVEKAVFYAEHRSVNSNGQPVLGSVIFAEIVSCLKRTLARVLVVIVSLGFGIVKPRLGSVFHRVISVGFLYFILSAFESSLRIMRPKNDPTNQTLLAGFPLAVLDSVICWWVFTALVQTTRTLRLRRNAVKLSLYNHFTNTLVIAVIVSVLFVIWQIHSHKLTSCLTDWKRLWIDEAFWHILFSAVLLVIMILWRPTQNNQRYAFTPLLDVSDDDEPFLQPPTYEDGIKLRQVEENSLNDVNGMKSNKALLSRETEEDLRWVQANIKDNTTPFVETYSASFDSDEDAMAERFERNKME